LANEQARLCVSGREGSRWQAADQVRGCRGPMIAIKADS